jgi:phosphatidylglycerophosphate synthase
MTLTDRAVHLAARAGLAPVRVPTTASQDPSADALVRSPRISSADQPETSVLSAIGDGEGVIVGANVLFGPEVLADLMSRAHLAGGTPMGVYDRGSPVLMYLPPGAASAVRLCTSIEAMQASLAARGELRDVPVGGFCRRLDRGDLARSVERDYIRHLTGKGESFFTKQIRRFSVPLTTHLVRLGAKPAHVTLGGLALAATSAWCLAQGSYGAGLLGGLLYYISMIFDCSDGEVARVTLREGPFGAWLETIVDYLTYFLLLAALTAATQNRPDAASYRIAATIALVGSVIVIAVASYLRHRVAAADPGQFDDASAKALATATRFHRFARWGRQWIKRSTIAHLVLGLAVINQLPVLLYLWAFGATVASIVILAVEPFVVRRVTVAPAGGRQLDTAR